MNVGEHKWFVGLAALAALFSFGLATQIFGVWNFVLLTWFAGLALQYVPGVGDRLAGGTLVAHRFASVVFPIHATLGKYREVRSGVLERSFVINAFQHVGWSFCLVLVFAPILSRWRRGLRLIEQSVLCVGLACLLGNMNEVLQWSRRVPTAAHYSDTINDLIMNAIGALLASLLLRWFAGYGLDRRSESARVSTPSPIRMPPSE